MSGNARPSASIDPDSSHRAVTLLEGMTRRGPHPAPADAVCRALRLDEAARLLADVPLEWFAPEMAAAVPARRFAFAAGRACARDALRAQGSQRLQVGRGGMGEPVWPQAHAGSITHAAGIACAVVAPARGRLGIGLDSESLLDPRAAADVLAICCTERERRALFGHGTDLDRISATLLFSVKESYFKAVHPVVRRFVDFDEIEVTAIDFAQGVVLLEPAERGADDGRRVAAQFSLESDAVHSLVDLRTHADVLLRECDPRSRPHLLAQAFFA